MLGSRSVPLPVTLLLEEGFAGFVGFDCSRSVDAGCANCLLMCFIWFEKRSARDRRPVRAIVEIGDKTWPGTWQVFGWLMGCGGTRDDIW